MPLADRPQAILRALRDGGTLQTSTAFPVSLSKQGQVAQLVEQRTENPCVGGSIPSLATIMTKQLQLTVHVFASVPAAVSKKSLAGTGQLYGIGEAVHAR